MCDYFHGGLKSQSPHLVGLWPGLKSFRLSPNRSIFSSVGWIISPLVTLLGWKPDGGSGRELALSFPCF